MVICLGLLSAEDDDAAHQRHPEQGSEGQFLQEHATLRCDIPSRLYITFFYVSVRPTSTQTRSREPVPADLVV